MLEKSYKLGHKTYICHIYVYSNVAYNFICKFGTQHPSFYFQIKWTLVRGSLPINSPNFHIFEKCECDVGVHVRHFRMLFNIEKCGSYYPVNSDIYIYIYIMFFYHVFSIKLYCLVLELLYSRFCTYF